MSSAKSAPHCAAIPDTPLKSYAKMTLQRIDRRSALFGGAALMAAPWASVLQAGCARRDSSLANSENENTNEPNQMKIHYLEIVTPDVDASVALYSEIHGVSFNPADDLLGGARTAKLENGGTLGIRAPMRATETPVVRVYYLVEDIEKAVVAAAEAGAEIAMTPTEIPGRGRFAIFIKGGIETGLWQV